MSAGMTLCSLSFLIAGFLQIRIGEVREPDLNGRAGLTFLNAANCTVTVKAPFDIDKIPAFTASPYIQTEPGDITVSLVCDKGSNTQTAISTQKDKAYRIIIASEIKENQEELKILTHLDERNKDGSGNAVLSIVSFVPSSINNSIVLKPYKDNQALDEGTISVSVGEGNAANFITVEPGSYKLFIPYTNTTSGQSQILEAEPVLNLGTGSVRTVAITLNQSGVGQSLKALATQFIMQEDNKISVLCLIPQYFIITVGEILFSITGLSFAYSQAPASMKSVLQSFWLLTVALGNLIDMIVAEIRIPSQTMEFFMFAGVMFLDAIVFMIMAYMYKSRTVPDISHDVEGDSIGLFNRKGSSDKHGNNTDSEKED